MLNPRALIVTEGWLASWMSVEVTYAIKGFFPMYTASRGPSLCACGFCCGCASDISSLVVWDNLNLEDETIIRVFSSLQFGLCNLILSVVGETIAYLF